MYIAETDKILWQFQEYVYNEKDHHLYLFRKPNFWTDTTGSVVDLYFLLLSLNRFNKYIIDDWQNSVSEAIIITSISTEACNV